MKSISILSWCLIMAAGSFWTAAAEPFRTDINPALLYWQAVGELPELSEADHGYVFTNQWVGRPLDERFGQLMGRYDLAFKFVRRAAKSRVPCDWGVDLTDGPLALLPGLAKWKNVAQVARLRALWHLQRGDQAAAREDLLAAFVLGRHTSKDGILISALVQIAIENIITAAIAESFYHFSPETLKQLAEGVEASPLRGTIAQCVPFERYSFPDWIIRQVKGFQTSAGSEEKALGQARNLLRTSLIDGDKSNPDLADKVIKAAGGTTAGLIRYAQELHALYSEADVLMTLPYAEFVSRIKAFNEKVEKHPNLLVHMFFAVFENCRNKEFAAEISLAMLRAGIEHRLAGSGVITRVQDPVLKEPFGLRRFQFEGVDRGFELSSKFKGRGFDEVLIFVEKDGPALQVIGKNAGKPRQ
jgi:hypothetical protein